MTALDRCLEGVERLAVDTAPVIYLIERHPRYEAAVVEVFRRIAAGSLTGVTSVLTLTEVLAHPLREGDTELSASYERLLLRSRNFATLPLDHRVATTAAGLRARYQLRTPDALQVACAVEARCAAFLTNDSRLRRVTEVRVIVLEGLVEEVSTPG